MTIIECRKRSPEGDTMHGRRIGPGWAVLLAVAAGVAPAAAPPRKQTVMVPMRDGVKLATDVYLPDGPGPWPVVLERTPYDRTKQGAKLATFGRSGYAVAVQDWRGLFASE